MTCFAPAEINSAVAMSASKFDGCVFEMEHNPWDSRTLRDCLQYMLNRAQIIKAASVVPAVAPLVRIPVNGVEMAQWQAKQALDMGCYGIVFPHISTVAEAALAICARLSMYCRQSRSVRLSHGLCSISNTQPSNFEVLIASAESISAGAKHVNACCPDSSARMTQFRRGKSAILKSPHLRPAS